jgi:hypothetical protein
MSRARAVAGWIAVAALAALIAAAFPLLRAASQSAPGTWPASPWIHYGGRLALVAASLGAWFLTQSLIGSRAPLADGEIGDLVHDLTAPANRWLHAHPKAADRLLVASSLGIDCFGVALIASAVLGPSLRPFLALFLLFLFRQLCQVCCALPAPRGLIWRHPGVPSLLVTYTVANDFFISGHTAIAVLGAIEAVHQLPPWAAAIAAAVAAFEACAVLVLRAHYTMDVLAAITAAFCAAVMAARLCVGV